MKAISKFFTTDFEITLFLENSSKIPINIFLRKYLNLQNQKTWHPTEIQWFAFCHQKTDFVSHYAEMLKISAYIANDIDQLDLSQYILNGMPNPAITQKIEEIVKNNID